MLMWIMTQNFYHRKGRENKLFESIYSILFEVAETPHDCYYIIGKLGSLI